MRAIALWRNYGADGRAPSAPMRIGGVGDWRARHTDGLTLAQNRPAEGCTR
jgi:hypothetical protein